MPYQREAVAVLAMWREVERSLANAEAGSAEAERLRTHTMLLRDEYQRLIREAQAHDRPLPSPFPEPSEAG